MDRATMGGKKKADCGDGVLPDLNRERYESLIIRFWRNLKMTRKEMDELDSLHLLNIDKAWAASAAKKEVES
jgi:hypothetical protein